MMGSAGRIALALGVLLLAAAPVVALASATQAPGDPSPYANNAIRARYTTRIVDSLEGFEILVDLRIHEVEVAPLGGHSAAELRLAPAAVRSLFEDQARAAIVREVAQLLPDARVTLPEFAIAYGTEDFDADAYDPPVLLHARVRADFTPAFFGLPTTTQTPGRDLARALLYSGGTYVVAKDLEVPPGFRVEHVLDVPDFLQLYDGGIGLPGPLVYRADNSDGVEPGRVRLDFAVRLREAAPENVRAGPLVRAVFVVDDATPTWKQSLPFLGGDYRGELDLDIQVHSLDASLFGAYPLPRQVVLPQVSADLLRIAVREGLVLRADVESFFSDLIRRSLEEGFGPDVALDLDWQTLTSTLNEPVGGRDGATVTPLLIRAHALLPFASNKMLVSSSLGRLVGMTVGTSGEFDLSNDGLWDAEYTVAYPKGVHVSVSDSAGLATDENWGEREGFVVRLPRGSATRMHVEGRSDFDTQVFAIGLAEIGFAALFIWTLVRRFRGSRQAKTTSRIA